VYARSEEKIDNSMTVFYEESEQVFEHFLKDHVKILVGDFSAKWGREGIFKPKIAYENLHQDRNDNSVRIVNVAT